MSFKVAAKEASDWFKKNGDFFWYWTGTRENKIDKDKEIGMQDLGTMRELRRIFPELDEDVLSTLLEAANNNLSLAVEAALIIEQQEQKSLDDKRGCEHFTWTSLVDEDKIKQPMETEGMPPFVKEDSRLVERSTGVQGVAEEVPYTLSRWECQVLMELRQPRRGKQVTLSEDFLRLPEDLIGTKEGRRQDDTQKVQNRKEYLAPDAQRTCPLESFQNTKIPVNEQIGNPVEKVHNPQPDIETSQEKSVLDEEYYTGGEYSVRLQKTHYGLGVTLKERDGFLCVEGLYSGDGLPGPAERAGIQIGDRLLGIGNHSTDERENDTDDGTISESSALYCLSTVEELLLYLQTSSDVVTLRFSRPADSVYTGLTKKAAFPAAHRLPVLLYEDGLVTAAQARQIDAQMTQLISRAEALEKGTLFPEKFSSYLAKEQATRSLAQISEYRLTPVNTQALKNMLVSAPMQTREKVCTQSTLRPAISLRIIGTDVGTSEGPAAEQDQGCNKLTSATPSSTPVPLLKSEDWRTQGLSKLRHFTVYILWIFDCRSGAEWKCRRRFSQFRQLQEQICRLCPALAEMDFPPRLPETIAVINDRKERLEKWLRQIFAHVLLVQLVEPSLAQVCYSLQEFLDVPPRLESLKMLERRPERENRQRIQVWVYQLLCLPFFDKILSNFVKHLPKTQKCGRGMLSQMKQFINHLQLTLLEGCYNEICTALGLENDTDHSWQTEEKIHTLVSKGIRRQIESEVYIPLMGILMERLQLELKEEEELIQCKIESVKHLPQSYFGVPLHRLSPSSWHSAIYNLQAISGFTLPCDKLDTLVACANEIPALFKREHPDSDKPLGADEFLPIFIYILIQSEIHELVLLSTLLCNLCDPDKRLAETGYYLATFEAAVQHIVEADMPL